MSEFSDPTNWTPELNKLLRKWKKQLQKRQKGHIDLARKCQKYHYAIGIPATVFSTIIATGSFATFSNCDDDSGRCEIDVWIRISTGVIAIIGAALTGFQTFVNYQNSAERNKSAAVDYGSMYRSLDTLLLLPPELRGEPVSTLQTLRNQYDDIVRRSPTLSSYYDALTYNVIKKNSKVELNRLSKELYNANDFDTDDEDEDVNIAFNIDSSVPFYTGGTEARIEDRVQNSLNRALNFELGRLERHAGPKHQEL